MTTADGKVTTAVAGPLEGGSAAAWKREQVRAVGTEFLRLRPVVTAGGIALNTLALRASGAPQSQRLLVLACMAALFVAFVVEAWVLRTRTVTEAWLRRTLGFTFVALSVACALTGAIRSPLLPLLFAPVGVAFAAYGRTRALELGTLVALLAIAALAWWPASRTLPPIAPPWDGYMTVVSAAVSLLLLRIGVAGLSAAHAASSETLERLRAGALLEARERALQGEALGAKVAHELKNPLTSIKGLLQLLERGTSEDKDQTRLRVALEEVERMQAILEEYLSFARAPTQREPARVRLDLLLRDLVLLVEPTAAAQAVELSLRAAALEVCAEPTRIKDAVLNLMVNALAAMPAGGSLRLVLEERGPIAAIVVWDSGQGMSQAQLASAGTPFVSHREGGTGLGLAIARGVARQHGGELSLISMPGRGTTATLTLRAEAAADQEPAA